MNSEDQYLECFNNFINQLKIIFVEDDIHKTLDEFNEYTNEKKIYNGLYFSSLLDDEHFDLLVNSKIKLFSHKNPKTQEISESLFGKDFCLKNILNNQPDDVKKIIWFNLHSLYLTIEKTKSEEIQNKVRLNLINKLINNTDEKPKINFSSKDTKNKLQEILDVDINNETTDMIDDIIKSFEGIINNPKGGNPLSGIMDISQKISVKYSDKINNGEIELDKLMESITKKVPGMEKMMSGMTNGNGDMKDMMGSMMGGMMGGNKKEHKEKVLIDENFSTSNVPVGVIEEKPSNNIKLGSILKVADQFGVIPGGKKENKDNKEPSKIQNDDENSGLPSFEGIPNLGKVMEMMQKLNNTTSPDDAENLKKEMNTFLQNDLGIDINSFNEQLEEVTKNFSEPDNNID